MNQKSNKVLTVFVICFYLFALGSFGIRGRWIFIITLFATTLTALASDRLYIHNISKIKKYFYFTYGIIAFLILLPNARHEEDIINFLIFVTITVYVLAIAETNEKEINRVKSIMIRMGLFFAIYVSFFSLFRGVYEATVYRFLASPVKEMYIDAKRFSYGLVIGYGYTFSDTAIWFGICAVIANDLSEQVKSIKYKIYLIIMLLGVLLEGRKGELVASLLTIVFMYYYGSDWSIRVPIRRIKYIIYIIPVGLIGIVYLSEAGLLNRFAILFERLGQVKAGKSVDYSSGRFELWENAIKLFMKYPIFGAGWGRFANYTEGFYQALKDEGLRNTHNVLLQLLCETGIVGTLMIVMPITIIYRKALKLAKMAKNWHDTAGIGRSFFSVGILLYSIILSFIDPNFYGQYFWCMFVVAILFVDYPVSEI